MFISPEWQSQRYNCQFISCKYLIYNFLYSDYVTPQFTKSHGTEVNSRSTYKLVSEKLEASLLIHHHPPTRLTRLTRLTHLTHTPRTESTESIGSTESIENTEERGCPTEQVQTTLIHKSHHFLVNTFMCSDKMKCKYQI